MEACLLRFSEHKLYLRKMATGVVGVLSAVKVNMPALRMVANLVIRRIEAEVGRPVAQTPPTGASTPSPLPAAALPALGAAFDPGPASSRVGIPVAMPLRQTVVPQDGRDSTLPAPSERHVRMYRGRRVDD